MADRWPDIAGRMIDDVHVLPVRIYHEDTDFSGSVYHASYLRFCERGRSDLLRLIGIHHHALLEGEGRLGFVVRRMACEFLSPASIDQVVEVETRLVGCSGARLEIDQQVIGGGRTLFKAAVTVALVDGRGRPRRLPRPVLDAVLRLARRRR